MDKLFYFIERFKLLYRIAPHYWPQVVVLFLMLWTALMFILNKLISAKHSSSSKYSCQGQCVLPLLLNLLLALAGLILIILITYVRRRSGNHRIILLPLRVLYGYTAPRDYWHVSLMNIMLYVPFACGLAFCLERSYGWLQHYPSLATVLICLFLSVTAEALQYFSGSGMAEVDDVLMNTLGAFFGTLSCTVCRKMCCAKP